MSATVASSHPSSVTPRRIKRPCAVRDPRGLLREFGTDVPPEVAIRVHDSNANMRYLIMPMRPAGSESMSEAELATLITRDTMIGVTTAKLP